ncbi:Aste57867_24369 [Aphanomyces stellatus]|uniref:Aste57867_24369 protein n=1 Tax=Aphanomyces stellatus TaxID=120398 RepID=A0A485LQ67_9STRA|nr:hypothetical protein As57867_024293 [Aphanomyces stellatus]VFU01009.1 Aste57867_24369 [Aphanomyces stellatus]
MGNQHSTFNPAREAAELGRRPDDEELILLFKLQTKFLTRLVECPYVRPSSWIAVPDTRLQHVGLLERYWESMMHTGHVDNNHVVPFQRTGPGWRSIGFSTENPADDIRVTGEFGLECLVFFVENYPGESRMMNRQCSGYPFAKAGVAVVRVLMEIFHVIEVDGSRGQFPVRDTLYWQLLESDASVFRLFAFCFLMFDELFCELASTDKSLLQSMCSTSVVAKLADQGKEKLLATLRRAPEHLTDLAALCTNGQVLRNRNLKLQIHDHRPKASPWAKPKPQLHPIPTLFQPTTTHHSNGNGRGGLFDGLVQKQPS